MKLQLDSSALQILFPAGTAAQVELRRLVVAQLLERMCIKDLKHMDDALKQQAQEFIRKQIVLTAGSQRWGEFVLSGNVMSTIRQRAQELVDQALKEAFSAIEEELPKRIEAHIDRAVQRGITHDLNVAINRAVDAALKGRDLNSTMSADTIKRHVRDALKEL